MSTVEVEVVGDVLNHQRASELVTSALASRGIVDGHASVSFVSADRIADLNAEHRGKAGPTDVLSFPIDGATAEVAGPREVGDIVICAEYTTDVEEAVVHGALHLAGLDHETDDGQMLVLQDELMAELRSEHVT